MVQQPTMFDALNNRRKILVARLGTEAVKNSPSQLKRIAHELREISKRLEAFLPE